MQFRNIIFWLHLICGVTAGVIILIMSVTGSILAFEKQIVAFAERKVRIIEVAPEATKLDLNSLLANAKKENSKAQPSTITVYPDAKASVAVAFGREGTVYVNPYTGQVLGNESSLHHFMDDVEVWHRWLGGREKYKPLGHNVKGVCNIIFLIMIISGFYLWWPRSWTANVLKTIMFFNPRLKGKARDWNWHNTIGFWCAPWLIIISLTGLIMSYQWANDLLFKMAGSTPPPVQSQKKDEAKGDEAPFEIGALDPILLLAMKQEPAWKSIVIHLPSKPSDNLNVTITTAKRLFPFMRSLLTVNLSTFEIVKYKPFSDESRGRKWRTIARYLHTGEAAGIVGQIVVFIAAIGASVLVWTGLWLSWRRFFKK